MVEGHGCHRVAYTHRKLLLGHKFIATSPNGRFAEGAKLISNRVLSRVEVIGKNLYYFFSQPPSEDVVVHIHFGMSGAFRTLALGSLEPKPTTRLRLINHELGLEAHLGAMTCEHGGPELFANGQARLGPDPLREDADPEVFYANCRASKRSIGHVLMSQVISLYNLQSYCLMPSSPS